MAGYHSGIIGAVGMSTVMIAPSNYHNKEKSIDYHPWSSILLACSTLVMLLLYASKR